LRRVTRQAPLNDATLLARDGRIVASVTKNPAYLGPIHDVVGRFHAKGGNLMFGTGVGYMTDYSTGQSSRAAVA